MNVDTVSGPQVHGLASAPVGNRTRPNVDHSASSSSYAAEFDPLAGGGMASGGGSSGGAGAGGGGYGAEGGAYGGDPSVAAGGGVFTSAGDLGASGASKASGAGTTGNNYSEKPGYELLDREMQYMLKFVDPEQNVASMDELIQSGVDLLDLLPPEEGGVKPRFSNPSNDWKYDIIAKSLDACNPVSECTCHHYDGRTHDIHLCAVHHDTVSQDSDTLTMDTEGSVVHVPTIKLQSSGAFSTEGKTDSVRHSNSSSGSGGSSTTLVNNSPNTCAMSDNTTTTKTKAQKTMSDPSAHIRASTRTGGGHSELGDSTTHKTKPAESNTHGIQQVAMDTGHHPDDASEEGGRNATVIAEVHVDATAMKYDATAAAMDTSVGHNTRSDGTKSSQANPSSSGGATGRSSGNPGTHNNPTSSPSNSNTTATTPPTSSPPAKTSRPSTSPTNTASAKASSSNPSSSEKASTSTSTSTSKSNVERFLSRPTETSAQAHRKKAFTKRPSLPIEPRTTQYQKHALLQERSDTGVLEFELMLAERLKEAEDERARQRQQRLSNRKCSLDSSRMKLTPRTNQYEQHALLRKTNSGMSEIEEILYEKEQEFIRKMEEKRNSTDVGNKPDPTTFVLHRGSLGRLEPRLGQYEKHSLLQSKDEDGKTALEMFLEEEMNERKTSVAEQQDNYSDRAKLTSQRSNASDTSASNKGSIKKTKSLKSSMKKVHFERGGSKDKKKKPDEPESGISSKGEPSSTASDPSKPAPEGQGQDAAAQGQGQGHDADNGYDTDDDDKTEEDRLTGERAKKLAKLKQQEERKCCTIL